MLRYFNAEFFPLPRSPWYDLRGWLGVKQQLSILFRPTVKAIKTSMGILWVYCHAKFECHSLTIVWEIVQLQVQQVYKLHICQVLYAVVTLSEGGETGSSIGRA